MRYLFFILITITQIHFICANNQCINKAHSKTLPSKINTLHKTLSTANSNYVLVVAHRGDWTSAPENSLEAIRNAINIGVDILEIDIRLTKDKIPVLMHDKTLDRTTTGKGKIKNWTLDSLNKLFLIDKYGNSTSHKIPTLEEALLLSRGKILINLDKCTMHLNKIVSYLIKTNTLNQAIIRSQKDFHKTQLHKRCRNQKLLYIPRIEKYNRRLNRSVKKYITSNNPVAFDIKLAKKDLSLQPLIDEIKKSCRVWVSTTSTENFQNNKHFNKSDNEGYKWDWALNSGANIILTDEPATLINYLERKGLRKIEAMVFKYSLSRF